MVKPVSLFEASSGKTFATEFDAHKDDLIGSLTAACGNAPTAVQMVDKLINFEALHVMSEAIIGMMAHHPSAPALAEAPCPIEAAIMPELKDSAEHATHVKDGVPMLKRHELPPEIPHVWTSQYKNVDPS